MLSSTLPKRGKPTAAVEAALTALALDPLQDEALIVIAEGLEKQETVEHAVQWYERYDDRHHRKRASRGARGLRGRASSAMNQPTSVSLPYIHHSTLQLNPTSV